jgi:hypothetical protein
MKLFLFLFLSGFIILSCKEKPAATGESSTQEAPADLTNGDTTAYIEAIMKVHDNAMSKMPEINNLETRIREIRRVATQGDLGSAGLPDHIDEIKEMLKKADDAMFDWMEYYSGIKAKLQKDLMLEFLKAELAKVNKVNKDLDNAIEKTNAWLAAHPNL